MKQVQFMGGPSDNSISNGLELEKTSPKPDRVSKKFCSEDADVAIRSKDGVLFRVHSVNLSCGMGALADTKLSADPNEIAQWQESSETLELLFPFLYPHPYSHNLENKPFKVVADLAEAVHKWQMFTPMSILHAHMCTAAAEHPFEVFCYSKKHGYKNLASKLAKYAIASEPFEMLAYCTAKDYTPLREECIRPAISRAPRMTLAFAINVGDILIADMAAPHTTQFKIAEIQPFLSDESLICWVKYKEKCFEKLLKFNESWKVTNTAARQVIYKPICAPACVEKPIRTVMMDPSTAKKADGVTMWDAYKQYMQILPSFSDIRSTG